MLCFRLSFDAHCKIDSQSILQQDFSELFNPTMSIKIMAHDLTIAVIAQNLRWDIDSLIEVSSYFDIILNLIENPDDKTLEHIRILLTEYQRTEECHFDNIDYYLDALQELAE
jgi:hypothetical protein